MPSPFLISSAGQRSTALLSALLLSASLLGCPPSEPPESPTPLPSEPRVEIVSPSEGSAIDGAQVQVEGLAESDGEITRVSVRLDAGQRTDMEIVPGPSVDFSGHVEFTSAGIHSLEVSAYDDSGLQGSATVSFLGLEPNESREEAAELPLPFASTELVVGPDQDWYVFEVQERSSVLLTVAPTSSGYSYLETTVQDEEGRELLYASSELRRQRLDCPPGRYFIYTRSIWSQSLAYQLSLEAEALEPDALEPNDTSDEATELTGETSVEGLWLSNYDTDWYRLSLPDSRLLEIVVAVEEAMNTPLRLTLHNEAGELLVEEWVDEYDGEGSISTFLPGGTYLLLVEPLDSSRACLFTYSLEVEMKSVSDDALEENDSPDAAHAITLPFQSDSLVLAYDDEDWYSFELIRSSYLRFELDVDTDESVETSLTLVDENDYTLEYSSTWDGSHSFARMLSAGRYRIGVFQSPWNEPVLASYRLSLEIDPGIVDDACEENDSFETACVVESNLDKAEFVLAEGDVDWFRFTLTQERMVTLDVDAESIGSELDLGLWLYDSEEWILGSSEDDGSSRDPRMAILLPAGDYTVRLSGYSYSDLGYGSYRLSLTQAPLPDDDTLEPNDGFSTATAVSLPYFNDALILVQGNADWFLLEVEREGVLFADVDARSSGSLLSSELELLNDQGETVAWSNRGDFGDPYLQAEVSPGQYYLQVSMTGNLVAADAYALAVSLY